MGNTNRRQLLGLTRDNQPLDDVASDNGGYYLTDCHIVPSAQPGANGMWVRFQNGRTGYFSSRATGGQLQWLSPSGPSQQFKMNNGFTARRYANNAITLLPPGSDHEMPLSTYASSGFNQGRNSLAGITRSFSQMPPVTPAGPPSGPPQGPPWIVADKTGYTRAIYPSGVSTSRTIRAIRRR